MSAAPDKERVTEPTLLDALLPVGVLIGLIAMTIVLFGIDSTGGPLQVALLLAAAFAALMAHKNGVSYESLGEAAIAGVTAALQAVFILLAVGALIGTWNMAGTIPTIVSYGLEILSARWFYLATCVVCGIVGFVTGSSWTTAGTLGVAFVGMSHVLGVSEAITAGAVISGAYLGDKMTPLSETTILVPRLVGGLTTNQHIRAMMWTSGPAFGLSLVVFGVMGFNSSAQAAVDVSAAQAALGAEFKISVVALLPLVLLLVLTLRKAPPFLALMGSALFAGVLALFTQQPAVSAFVDAPDLGRVATGVSALFSAMGNGFMMQSGNETIDTLFSGGGMSSMLFTVWLIFGALSFAAIMEHAGFLERLIRPVVMRARSNAGLLLSVLGTAIGLNLIAGDQYVADVMTARAYPAEFAARGIAPHVLSRAVEDSGTVTSPLIPWNSCGAYMAGVLGVATLAYLPYCIFNIASPIVDLVVVGLLGFKFDRVGAPGPTHASQTQASQGAPPSVRGT